jgi:hypothetical protein
MTSVLRKVAFGLMLVLAGVGAAFVVGNTFAEPGGSTAVLYTASWAVPMIALAGYALRRPGPATTVLAVLVAASALFVVLDATFDLVDRDGVGPVGSIAVFVVCVAAGFLGLSRPWTAGWLLIIAGAANLAGPMTRVLESRGAGGFGGSATAVAVPALLIGGLYLAAEPRDHGQSRSRARVTESNEVSGKRHK